MTKVTTPTRSKWNVWCDVIFALFTREIRTGFSDKFGLSWAIVNPVAFVFILSYIRSAINGEYTYTLSTFTFMAIGILYIQSFLKTLTACAMSIRKNKALFAFRQVQPISAVIAAMLFEFLVKVFSLISLLIIMYFIGLEIQISDGLRFIACFCLLLLLAVSLGLLFGISELYIAEIAKVRELIARPLFFISGTFFSLQDIPREFWHFFTWNPILHAIEVTRNAAQITYSHEGTSLTFLSTCVVSVLFCSLAVYFILWKQAISR